MPKCAPVEEIRVDVRRSVTTDTTVLEAGSFIPSSRAAFPIGIDLGDASDAASPFHS